MTLTKNIPKVIGGMARPPGTGMTLLVEETNQTHKVNRTPWEILVTFVGVHIELDVAFEVWPTQGHRVSLDYVSDLAQAATL